MLNKRAYFWGFVNQFIPQAINLFTNILLARYLSPKEFGMVGVLSIFTTISAIVSDSGLGGSLIKEKNLKPIDYSTVFTFNFIVSIILYVVICIIAPYVEKFYNIARLTEVTRCLCVVFLINAFMIVPKSVLMKELNFAKIAYISIGGMITGACIAFCGYLFNWGVYCLVMFQIGNALASLCLTYYLTKFEISLKFSIASFKKLFPFGIYTTICGIIDSIYENILSVFLGRFCNVQAVGYYDQAKKLESGSAYALVGTINTVSFPILTKQCDEPKRFREEAFLIQRYCYLLVFPILGFFSIYSYDIIRLLYGIRWIETSTYLSILMINGMIYIADMLLRNNIKSLGYVKSLAKYTLLKRIIGIGCISLALIINKQYLLYGLITSTCIGLIVNLILYCKIGHIRIVEFITQTLQYLFLPLLIIGLIYVIHLLSSNCQPNICASGIILMFYYIYIICFKFMKWNQIFK